jgi:hypothetical protein
MVEGALTAIAPSEYDGSGVSWLHRTRVTLGILALVWSWSVEARDLDAARDHYRKAAQAFQAQAFDKAADEYTLSYQASDDPVLLYNIAVSLRMSHQRPQAMRAYRMYLKRVPTADNRAECEQAIRDLSKAAAAPAPSPAPT